MATKTQARSKILSSPKILKTKEINALTPAQRMAVRYTAGPLLIIAGAGTGKTRVITEKIVYLLHEKKLRGDEILALTFSNKATEEMEQRLDLTMPLGYEQPWISTFHAFGERILRQHALDLGLAFNFKILTPAEQHMFIRKNIFRLDLDYYRPQGNPAKYIAALAQHFNRAKDEAVTPEQYINWAKEQLTQKNLDAAAQEEAERYLEIAQAYKKYNQLLHESDKIDLADLVVLTYQLLIKRANLLKRYQEQFKFILVDEFQDTNLAQYQLVKLLAARHQQLTVVADDDQAIYRWRGASVANVMQFMDDYPRAKKVALLDNFRSKQIILNAAHRAVQFNNPYRLEKKLNINKKLLAMRGGGGQVLHYQSATQEHEVEHLMKLLIEKHAAGRLWSELAILVRANSAAEILAKAFSAKGIPFQFSVARGLFSRPEIIDLLAFLRSAQDPHDSVSLFRLLRSWPHKLDPIDLANILRQAKKNNQTMFEVITAQDQPVLKKVTQAKLQKFIKLLSKYVGRAQEKSAAQVLYEYIAEIKLFGNLTKNVSAEKQEQILNINKLFSHLKQFEQDSEDTSARAFLELMDLLLQAGENPAPADLEASPDVVNILTVHAAKGLEFPVVFIFNLVEQHFPSTGRSEPIPLPQELVLTASKKDLQADLPPTTREQHLAEERRLFYVACTRAKDELICTSSLDQGGLRKRKTSRFVHESGLISKITPESNLSDLVVKTQVLPERHIKLPLPKQFSFTQLTVFETCPLQYKYSHLYKIPSLGSHVFSYGKSLHEVLADFYLLFKKEQTRPTQEKLLALLEQHWHSEWYLSKKHERECKDKAQKALVNFYQTNLKSFKPAFWIEKDFKLKIDEYILKGRIDRADQLPDGTLEIIDYKTGTLKNETKIKKSDQLALYALAAQQVYKQKVSKLSWYYLDEGKVVSTTRSLEELKDLQKSIKSKINEILTSQFIPTPGFHCKYCDFNKICEAGLASGKA